METFLFISSHKHIRDYIIYDIHIRSDDDNFLLFIIRKNVLNKGQFNYSNYLGVVNKKNIILILRSFRYKVMKILT